MSDPQTLQASQRQGAVPTNTILYKEGYPLGSILLLVGYIVEIMSNSFDTDEHHITLCLRDESDTLVTQSNLASKVTSQEPLKLVPSPTTEALSVVLSLQQALTTSTDPQPRTSGSIIPLKLALFNLQKYVKEEEFAIEFMLRQGTRNLFELVQNPHDGLTSNALAYALQGILGLLEYEAPWKDLNEAFVQRILSLLVTATQPNVLRAVTAVIRKLVVSSPYLERKDKGKGKARTTGTTSGSSTHFAPFGFELIWANMQALSIDGAGTIGIPGIAKIIVKRLEGTGDLQLVTQSLGLVNDLLQASQWEGSQDYPSLVSTLESLSVKRYVSRLIPTCSGNIVEPEILIFQSRIAAMLSHHLNSPVRPGQNDDHARMLQDIWSLGGLGESEVGMEHVQDDHILSHRDPEGWKRVGLEINESEEELGDSFESEFFRNVGELGLECLHHFATHEESFHNLVIEQEARGPERQCPIGRASLECVTILSDHYKIAQASQTVPTRFQPFLLNFPKLHSLVLKFFIRMWADSGARIPDFDKVALLVRSQVRLSLAQEWTKTWLNPEKDFLEAEYQSIRDRQIQMLEHEDGMLGRSTVAELRQKLGKEALDIVADQRVGCMMQGAWFNSSRIIVQGIMASHKASPTLPLRFVRLSPNRRILAWSEFPSRPKMMPSFESLRERIDLANVTEVRLQTGCPINTRSPDLTSKLSFSLMSGPELSLLDLDAVHAAQLAEWTDGVRIVRGEISRGTQGLTKETLRYAQILTELALKVRLLDITGDGVNIPEKVSHGLPPTSTDFWFAK